MEFSWLAVTATLLFWLVEAGISYQEETFWRSQGRVKMTFWWNWAISIGLPIFSIINGLVVPYLWPMQDWHIRYPLWLIIGYCLTDMLYKSWWREDENIGHVFASWEKSGGKQWRKDVSIAGWVHFVFMTLQIVVLGLYLISLMEKSVVIWVGILLFIFIVIINLQAKYVQKSLSVSWIFAQLIALILATAIKGALALR